MTSSPDITVIIPTRGRSVSLARALAALERQSVGSDAFEVIVINDGGPKVVLPSAAPPGTRILYQPNQGPAAARNHGAENAGTPLIAFLDDDCEPDSSWLTELRKAHEGRPGRLVAGLTLNGLEANIYATATQVMIDHLIGLPADGSPPPTPLPFVPSCNLLCARTDFFRLGPFDTSFPLAAGEDRLFCDQWLENGDIHFAPQAVVRHEHALGFRAYGRQHLNYGRGSRRYHRLTPKNDPTPPKFYFNLIRRPFQTGMARPITTMTLLLLAQILTAWGRGMSGGTSQETHPPPNE